MTSPLRQFSVTNPDGSRKTPAQLQQSATQLVRDAQQRAERIGQELRENVVTASSRDQAATVTVTATGSLQSVRLSDRSKAMTPTQLSASIMQAYQTAVQEASVRTIEISQQEGMGSQITTMMKELLPAEEETEAR
jgi:DNA-binding protein YbaB